MAIEMFEFTTTIVAIFATWSMLSALYGKANPLRSWAQTSYIGFTLGISLVAIWDFIYKQGIVPVMNGDWLMSLGLIGGVLMLSRLSKKYHAFARIPIAISVGTSLGLSLRSNVVSGFLAQIQAMMAPIIVDGGFMPSFYNLTTFVSSLLILTFFLYTAEVKGPLKVSSKLGEYCLYIGLGAIYAQNYMGRLGLLIGYFQTIMVPWKVPYTIGIGILVLAIVLILDRKGILEKYAN